MPYLRILLTYAALVAAVCLLAGCGRPPAGASSSLSQPPAAGSVSEEVPGMSVPFETEIAYAGSYNAAAGLAFTGRAASAGELAGFLAEHTGALGQKGNTAQVTAALERYDDAFFEESMLVLAVIDAGSGSARLKVDDVVADDGRLVLTISEKPLGDGMMGTADMARFLVLVELPAEYADFTVQVDY